MIEKFNRPIDINDEEAKQTELAYYLKQIHVIRELAKKLDIILKFDLPDDKKKQWDNYTCLSEIKGQDPIEYSEKNGYMIEGLGTYEWANKHILSDKKSVNINT